MKKRLFITILIIIITTGTLFAAESSTFFGAVGAYYFDDNKGYELNNGEFAPVTYTKIPAQDDSKRDLGSGWGGAEAKASITHKIKVPFMQGTGALTADNNILYQLKGELSPVSINAIASAKLTPIAFLNFQAGTQLGTGWNFFGINGLGLNRDGNPLETNIPGIVSKSWLSGTFQFDIGALIPGEWTHVIMAATGKAEYKYFSAAGVGDAWQYEADAGENFNGFSFMGTYFLGYQLPYKFNTVGFLLETEQMLGSNSELSIMDDNNTGWGSDFTQVTFGPLANIQLTDDSSLVILVQFRKEKLFTTNTIDENYFRDRDYFGYYIDFRRIAFSYSQQF